MLFLNVVMCCSWLFVVGYEMYIKVYTRKNALGKKNEKKLKNEKREILSLIYRL
jgi:hypothetical protein